eukprot:2833058-Pyramimonas_sp.AAC.2
MLCVGAGSVQPKRLQGVPRGYKAFRGVTWCCISFQSVTFSFGARRALDPRVPPRGGAQQRALGPYRPPGDGIHPHGARRGRSGRARRASRGGRFRRGTGGGAFSNAVAKGVTYLETGL